MGKIRTIVVILIEKDYHKMVHVEIKSKIGRYTVIYSTARDAASSLR